MTVENDKLNGEPTSGLFLGISTTDQIMLVEQFPLEDTKAWAKRLMTCAGGPATNAAIAFSSLGGDAQLISPVGNSHHGRLIKTELGQFKVLHVDIAGPNFQPAYSCIITSKESGTRTIVTYPSSGEVGPAKDINTRRFQTCLVDSSIAGHYATLLAPLKERGVSVILDGDLYDERLESALPFVDIAICGSTFKVPGYKSEDQISTFFQRNGVSKIAFTHGAAPIRAIDSTRKFSLNPRSVEVIDTLAAGDILHGAFCYFYTQKQDFELALRQAADVASQSTRSFGPRCIP